MPTIPIRIQLSRARGWRMPPDTVKVDRSTQWGNPFVPGLMDGQLLVTSGGRRRWSVRGPWNSADVVVMFEQWATGQQVVDPSTGQALRIAAELLPPVPDLTPLRGRNLACWCRLGAPCHAGVLLRLANAPV